MVLLLGMVGFLCVFDEYQLVSNSVRAVQFNESLTVVDKKQNIYII